MLRREFLEWTGDLVKLAALRGATGRGDTPNVPAQPAAPLDPVSYKLSDVVGSWQGQDTMAGLALRSPNVYNGLHVSSLHHENGVIDVGWSRFEGDVILRTKHEISKFYDWDTKIYRVAEPHEFMALEDLPSEDQLYFGMPYQSMMLTQLVAHQLHPQNGGVQIELGWGDQVLHPQFLSIHVLGTNGSVKFPYRLRQHEGAYSENEATYYSVEYSTTPDADVFLNHRLILKGSVIRGLEGNYRDVPQPYTPPAPQPVQPFFDEQHT